MSMEEPGMFRTHSSYSTGSRVHSHVFPVLSDVPRQVMSPNACMVLFVGIFQLCITFLLYLVYPSHYELTIKSGVLFLVHYIHNSGHFAIPGLFSLNSQMGVLISSCSSDIELRCFYNDPGTQVLPTSWFVIIFVGTLLFSCYIMTSIFMNVQHSSSTSTQHDLDDRVACLINDQLLIEYVPDRLSPTQTLRIQTQFMYWDSCDISTISYPISHLETSNLFSFHHFRLNTISANGLSTSPFVTLSLFSSSLVYVSWSTSVALFTLHFNFFLSSKSSFDKFT